MFFTEELWSRLGNEGSIHFESWPTFDPALATEEEVTMVVQVNGKVRGKITVPAEAPRERIEKLALADPRVIGFLDGRKAQRIVYVPRRLVNIVVEG